jgi:hypothetical protein
VEFRKNLAWMKDWRAAGAAGVIVGFVIGLLLFYAPWHMRPAYGDLATWLLVVLGAVGGFAALRQLGILQKQIKDEADRNVKRDQLLDRQLAEAEAREKSEQRRQAEDIELAHKRTKAFAGNAGSPARAAYVEAFIVNNSRRPITGIICKLMSRADGSVLREADTGGEGVNLRSEATDPANWVLPRWGSVTRCEVLAPGSCWAFRFDDLVLGDDHAIAVWFTDDAKVRWRLDEMQHLVQTDDESKYQG